jgi:hypothetical protein
MKNTSIIRIKNSVLRFLKFPFDLQMDRLGRLVLAYLTSKPHQLRRAVSTSTSHPSILNLPLPHFYHHIHHSTHSFNMVYNWDGKEAECYRLYVAEKKNLEEVMDYWEQRGFTPR